MSLANFYINASPLCFSYFGQSPHFVLRQLALVHVEAPVEAVAESRPALVEKEVIALGVGKDSRLYGQDDPRETHVLGWWRKVCLMSVVGMK